MYTEFKESEIVTIDLHCMQVYYAKEVLTRAVMMAPPEIREIVVIHGYHGGTALMNMVRNEFKCNRVARKFLSMNQGRTSLILA